MSTTERERELLALIKLLQEESSALRSVLSEWDEDKSCYIQMNRANIFRQAIECLEYKL
jgi:hypothetical protein